MHSKTFLVEAELEIIPGNLFSGTHLTTPFTTDEILLASKYSIAIQPTKPRILMQTTHIPFVFQQNE